MPTLNWIGKDKVVSHHQDVPYRVLEHKYGFTADKGEQAKPTNSGNKIIHGDNLEALKSLLPEYEGKINCIYIDPPYNTGNEGWTYNDNVSHPKMKKWLDETLKAKEQDKIASIGLDDLSRHDKWLCMIYPRLKLLHKLLANDGAIFISIDDNAQANLRLICDEIFGQRNFIANMVWQKRTSPDARKKISSGHEYVLVYVKNIDQSESTFNKLSLSDDDKAKFKNPDNDPRGPWVSTDCTAQAGHGTKSQFYTLKTPGGRIIDLPSNRCWRFTKERLDEQIADNRIWFGKDGKGVPRKKTFLSEREGKNLWTWWTNQEVGHTQEATKEIRELLPKHLNFDYPKPVRLISRIIQIGLKKNGLVLDSFAGSGTTAHAVLNLNKQDGGNRKFIAVEMEDYANDITAERVKRVAKGYGEGKKAEEGTGGAFDYYELGLPLFDETQNLNEEVGLSKIREYIWFSETRTSFTEPNSENYFLGKKEESAYYFIYEKDRLTTLDYDALELIKTKGEQYIIYADNCLLPREFMARKNIIFKKIPRDITRF